MGACFLRWPQTQPRRSCILRTYKPKNLTTFKKELVKKQSNWRSGYCSILSLPIQQGGHRFQWKSQRYHTSGAALCKHTNAADLPLRHCNGEEKPWRQIRLEYEYGLQDAQVCSAMQSPYVFWVLRESWANLHEKAIVTFTCLCKTCQMNTPKYSKMVEKAGSNARWACAFFCWAEFWKSKPGNLNHWTCWIDELMASWHNHTWSCQPQALFNKGSKVFYQCPKSRKWNKIVCYNKTPA